MRAQHTPGPWRVGKSGGSVVADQPITGMAGSDHVDYYGGHLVAESITPSNARLIAAAPELLEALQRYVAHDQRTGLTDNNLYRTAVAAIEKATGSAA